MHTFHERHCVMTIQKVYTCMYNAMHVLSPIGPFRYRFSFGALWVKVETVCDSISAIFAGSKGTTLMGKAIH